MKKIIEKEVEFCDACGKERDYGYKCMHCNFMTCFECGKTKMKKYQCGVHFMGSRDGEYCNVCDTQLMRSGTKLHKAYLNIQYLRQEEKTWYESFQIRSKEAEKLVEDLYNEYKEEI